MFVTFILIFKFILIYLLHVLFVLKIKSIFGKKNPTKSVERGSFLYIHSIDIDYLKIFSIYTHQSLI